MLIKNISCVYLLCFANFIHSSPFAVKLMLNKNEKETCTEKVTTEKSQLFMHVGKYEENFIKAYEYCLQTDDYYTDKKYDQARHCTLYAITKVIQHINNLEHGNHDEHTTCEKCEAKIIKKRLIALLEKKNNN